MNQLSPGPTRAFFSGATISNFLRYLPPLFEMCFHYYFVEVVTATLEDSRTNSGVTATLEDSRTNSLPHRSRAGNNFFKTNDLNQLIDSISL